MMVWHRLIAWLALAALPGCGGDATVAICWGSTTFCSAVFSSTVADAGPDQSVASGALVTLDGSDSTGNIDSYAWAQEGGTAVSLVNANRAVATFNAPFTASAVTLSFKLTVVDTAQHADTDSINVTVRP